MKLVRESLLKIIMGIMTFVLLSSLAFANVPSDVIGTPYQEAVARLGALGIMKGDSTGFRPEDSITRAEFAAVIVRAMGLESTVKNTDSVSSFDDIDEDVNWAAGYIHVAQGLNIINGVGDQKFAPKDTVTFEQAVKMILCALGYKPAADAKGGYPTGYINVAAEQDILKDIPNSRVGEAASRGLVAILMNNALETPMMIPHKSGKKTEYVISGTSGTSLKTLISTMLKLNAVDALIVSSGNTRQISVKTGTDYSQTATYTLSEGISNLSLQDTYVTLYADDKKTVYYIETKEDSEIVYDYIEKVNKDATVGASYYPNLLKTITTRNSEKEYKIPTASNGNADVSVSVNTVEASNEPVVFVNCFAKIILDNNVVKKIDMYNMTEGGIIISATPDSLNYTKGGLGSNTLNGVSSAENLTVIINGKPALYRDLKADMVFDYWSTADNKTFFIVASSAIIKEKLTAVKSDAIILGKNSYDLDSVYGGVYYYTSIDKKYHQSDLSQEYLQKNVSAYIDAKFQVRYIKYASDEEDSGSFIGIVEDAYEEGSQYLKVFELVGGAENKYEVDLNNSSTYSFDYAMSKASDYTGGGIFKFFLNSTGKIYKIEDAGIHDEKTVNSFADDDSKRLGNIYMTKSIICALTKVEGRFTPKLLDWTKDLRNANGSNLRFLTDYNLAANPYPKYVILTTGWESLASISDNYGIVTDITKTKSDKYTLIIQTRWSNLKYEVDRDFITQTGVKKYMLLSFKDKILGDNPIKIAPSKYDLSDDCNSWAVDLVGATGLFAGETLVDRNEIAIEALKDHVPTWIMCSPSWIMVYEVDETNSDNKFIKRSIGDISKGDKVWFYIQTATSANEIFIMFYQKQ